MSNDSNHPFHGQILLFKGQSQYDVLRGFIDELNEAFRLIGHRTVVIDLTDSAALQKLQAALSTPVFFALGMNGVGIDLKAANQSLYDAAGFPFFAFLVDHPVHHLARLEIPVNNLIVSCIDQSHVEYLERYIDRVCTRAFVPHGANIRSEPLPMNKRNFGVVLAGTYSGDPDDHRQQWKAFDAHLVKLLDDAVELAMYQESSVLIDILQRLLVEKGLGGNPVFLRKLSGLLPSLDHYIRTRRRKELIEALADYPIHLFGNGWEKIPNISSRAQIHSAISYAEFQDLTVNTKIMLSLLPIFPNGGHERIFMSMLGGAVTLSDSNLYMERIFKPGIEFVPYSLSRLDGLKGQIENLLSAPSLMEEISEAGRQAVLRAHLWRHRAEQIVEVAKFHYTFYPFK